jgi:hypothetical protein
MDITADSTFTTLKPGWASDVVAAIQATSVVPPSLLLQPWMRGGRLGKAPELSPTR